MENNPKPICDPSSVEQYQQLRFSTGTSWDNKYLSWVYGVDKKICHEGHWSASRGRTMILSDRFFLSTPYTHARYFFLHIFWFTTFDFQSKVTKEFLLKFTKLPATAIQFFTFA